ncbi:unnamed protein product [Rhizophagus irregularis]|nr:unnamed protein product [Rhizophagus irregularis]
MSFVRAHYFYRNILPSRQISFLQPPKITLGKSNSHFLRLSQLKTFTKSVSTSSSLQEEINPIFTAHPFITFFIKTASKEVGQGVIYVEIPASVYDLNEAFAKALNMSPNKFTFTNRIARSFLEGSKEPELKQYLEAIKYGAE